MYFVLSDGKQPKKILFDWPSVLEYQKTHKLPYLDTFDARGDKLVSYKFEDGKFTSDF